MFHTFPVLADRYQYKRTHTTDEGFEIEVHLPLQSI